MTRRKLMYGIIVVLAALVVAAIFAPRLLVDEPLALDEVARAAAPGDFAELRHGLVHYLDEGPRDGQTVVLVHGFSVPSYTWDRTAAALVAAGFRVIRFDLYGRGYSARPDVDYDRTLFVDQIDDLLDALEVAEPVDIVGLSMGGAIVTGYAADHPRRVRRVALMAPGNSAFDIGVVAWPVVGELINAAVLVPGLPEGQRADFVEPDDYEDWPERYRVQMQYRGFARGILSTIRNFGTRDPIADFERLGSYETPVLLLWGELDVVVPFSGLDRVASALGDATIVRLAGAGHALHYEQAEDVNPELVAFLTKSR